MADEAQAIPVCDLTIGGHTSGLLQPKKEKFGSHSQATEELEMKFDIAKVKLEPVDEDEDMDTAAALGEAVYLTGDNETGIGPSLTTEIAKEATDVKAEPADVDIIEPDSNSEDVVYPAITIEELTDESSQPDQTLEEVSQSADTNDTNDMSMSDEDYSPQAKVKPTKQSKGKAEKAKASTIARRTCKICHKVFKSRSDLTRHSAAVHSDKRPFSCDICHKTFTLRENLNYHSWNHSTERLYKCDRCSMSFSTKAELIVHMPTHLHGRPFNCVVCEAGFLQKSEFVSHYKVHNCRRLYECNECDKTFTIRSSLRLHKLIHALNKEKPFKCRVCNESFARFSTFKEHKRIHEPVQKPQKCDSGIQTDHPSDLVSQQEQILPDMPAAPSSSLPNMQLVVPKLEPGLSGAGENSNSKLWDFPIKKIKLEPQPVAVVSNVEAGPSGQAQVGPGIGKLVLPKIGNILLKLAKSWPGEPL